MTFQRRVLKNPLIWITFLYLLTGFVYIGITPGLEKPDEQGHYGYVRYLREERALPPLTPEEDWLFESKQPPLYYVIVASVTAPFDAVTDPDTLVVRNPYRDLSVPTHREDNRNAYLHPPYLTPIVLGGRIVSLLFGLGSLLCAYVIVRQIFPGSRWIAWASAAVVGFQPKFLFMATALNNDAAIAFFGTAVLALLLWQWRHSASTRRSILLGLVVGLACLTKVSALVFFPLVGISMLLIHKGLNREWLREMVFIAAVALFIGGWWYVRNAVLYQDPFTLTAHLDRSVTSRPFWQRLPKDLLDIERTLWGNPSRVFVQFTWIDKIVLWWGRLSLIAGIAATILYGRKLAKRWLVLCLLLIWPLTFFLFLILFWTREHTWAHARFLLPAIVPMMMFFLGGWYLLLPRQRWRKVIIGGSAVFFVILGLLSPWLVIYPLYHPYSSFDAEAIEHSTDISFQNDRGEVIATLVGYSTPEDQATEGSFVPVELCWMPERQTAVPYALFVQFLDLSPLRNDQSPLVWGRRETYPGLGNLPTDRWDVGQSFCDTVFVSIYEEVPAPIGAYMEVGLFDPETDHRLQPVTAEGDNIPYVALEGISILATDKPPIPRASEADYVLDDSIGLYNVDVLREEETLVVTTTWQSLDSVPYDAFLFIKVRDESGNIVDSADRPPLAGSYPTYYWVPGSWVTDVVTLEVSGIVDLESLSLGMYTWPDLTRLPVLEASGNAVRDNLIRLSLD